MLSEQSRYRRKNNRSSSCHTLQFPPDNAPEAETGAQGLCGCFHDALPVENVHYIALGIPLCLRDNLKSYTPNLLYTLSPEERQGFGNSAQHCPNITPTLLKSPVWPAECPLGHPWACPDGPCPGPRVPALSMLVQPLNLGRFGGHFIGIM